MTVQLSIPYETLVELVEQLPESQQRDLIRRIEHHQQELTLTEKMKLLKAAQIDLDVNVEPSLRRQDWYDDNER